MIGNVVDKYARAVVSLTTMPRALFETCEHFVSIDEACYQCEPILAHDPGFES